MRHPTSRLDPVKTARTALRFAAACVCALSSAEALAAWTADGQARLDSRYEDNVLLSPDTEDDAIVTTANAQGEVRRVTENSELSALAGVTYLDYSGVFGPGGSNEQGHRIWRCPRRMARRSRHVAPARFGAP